MKKEFKTTGRNKSIKKEEILKMVSSYLNKMYGDRVEVVKNFYKTNYISYKPSFVIEGYLIQVIKRRHSNIYIVGGLAHDYYMVNVPFFIKDYKEGKYENTYIYMYVTAEFYNGGLRCFLVGKPISKQVYNAFLKVAKFEKTLGIIGNNENDMLEQGIGALEEVRQKHFLPVAYKYGRMTSKLIEKGYAEDRT